MDFFSFDDEYLQRLRAGDPLVERHFCDYFDKLLGIKLRTRLRSAEAVADVKQETFARVFRTLRSEEGIRDGHRLGAYVSSVCKFVLFEHYRANRREEPWDDGLPEPQDFRVDFYGSLVAEDKRKQVCETLDSMDGKDRRILTALFLEEKDKDEICLEFGVDRDHLRVLLYRAKNQFRVRYRKPH